MEWEDLLQQFVAASVALTATVRDLRRRNEATQGPAGKEADADPEATGAAESGEESAEEALRLAPLRRAASVLAGSQPQAEALAYPPLAHAPMRQMLLRYHALKEFVEI